MKQFLPSLNCAVRLSVFLVSATTILSASSVLRASQEADVELVEAGARFLTQHCADCHDGSSGETEFRVDDLQEVSRRDLFRWKEIAARVKSGEMPPPEFAKQPTPVERDHFNVWLEDAIRIVELQQLRNKPPVQLHRLTRIEYANTIEALLGVPISEEELTLCADKDWYGIERIGLHQSMSATHFEQFISAAEAIVEEAFPSQEQEFTEIKFDAVDLAGRNKKQGTNPAKKLRDSLTPKPRIDLWPNQSVLTPPLPFQHDRTIPAGDYHFRIHLSGIANSNNDLPPHLTVIDSHSGRLLFEQDVLGTESAPIQINFRAHLSGDSKTFLISNEVNGPLILTQLKRSSRPFYNLSTGYLPWQVDFLSADGQPNYACLLVDSIEIRGPLVPAKTNRLRGSLIPKNDDLIEIQRCLRLFLSQAFRRPAKPTEIAMFGEYVLDEIQSGKSVREAMKVVMVSILCSRDFLYVVEGAADRTSTKINDWELATRLSYFLWSSMPDAELLDAARQKMLSKPDTLKKQVRRMMADPRSKRFAHDFCRQWLRLDQVGQFHPNAKLYPEYDPFLERSMVKETTNFFEKVFVENMSVREFIHSDWTIINPRLARHYGIKLQDRPDEDVFRVIRLAKDVHRGGLLTQAAILSQTSDGLRTRPVHRGVWLYEQFLGRAIPSPPANVPSIEPTANLDPKITFRRQLASHITNPDCAVCHRKIDPLGFAFENYDAIGQWRVTESTATGVGVPPQVDASGRLPDGRVFADARQFQELLMNDIDEIQLAFIKKLASYAARRIVRPTEMKEIQTIASRSAKTGYRVRDLVEAIVLSDFFRTK